MVACQAISGRQCMRQTAARSLDAHWRSAAARGPWTALAHAPADTMRLVRSTASAVSPSNRAAVPSARHILSRSAARRLAAVDWRVTSVRSVKRSLSPQVATASHEQMAPLRVTATHLVDRSARSATKTEQGPSTGRRARSALRLLMQSVLAATSQSPRHAATRLTNG